jgi:hypothetical protein
MVIFSVLLWSVLSTSIIAQNSTLSIHRDELIAFVRIVNGQKEYVVRYGNQRLVYPMPTDKCFRYSNDWRYLAIFEEGGNTLQMLSLLNNRLIIQDILTDIQFNSCALVWKQDNKTILVPMDDLNFYPAYSFYFDEINLTRLNDVNEPVYPVLPNWVELYSEFYSQSPNTDIVLYEACRDKETPDGTQFSCEVIIYDIAQDLTIEELDVDIRYLQGYDVDFVTERPQNISAPLVGWSYDARYVAFCDCEGLIARETRGFIKVYDLQTDTYLTMASMHNFNFDKRFSWSDNSYILAYWLHAAVDADADTSSLNELRFWDIKNNSYTQAQGVFDVISDEITWSPDSRAVAIVGKQRVDLEQPYQFSDAIYYPADLILIDTTTGEHTVIDTDVTEIITWRSICDFTATDTASLISTMQSEPYSVICLDENGQYDLTTPLPDVAGDITIIGNGATITMTGQNRVFNVVYNQQWSRNGSLTLKNVTLSGGIADDGGAIYNAGDLTLENVTLENHSAVRGGAIYNTGNLVMNGGAIQNNTASEFGGGIYNLGDMQLDGVNIRENVAPEGSGVYQG